LSYCLLILIFKVNTKLGGENWRIDVPLPESPQPIMIVGVSISHAEPESTDPSLVGFVGSTAQGGTQYVNYVHHQDPRLAIIHYQTFKAALQFLIGQFIARNGGAKPEKIIFYRGGASEGATQAILKNELADGIRKALMDIDDSYRPGITFICSIRGSKQKYFCKDEADMDGMGQNVPAGTVVAGYGNGVPGKLYQVLSFV
jgi:eukaryotic translation initiation factor 2C